VSNSNPPTAKSARPHRRLSLTMPTAPPEAAPHQEPAPRPETAAIPESPAPQPPASEAPASQSATVRVMAYLTEDEARVLDELWFSMRRDPARPSKSDILRASLVLAAQDATRLSGALAQQQNSTLSRQRSSKMPLGRRGAR
jgi:hypothetical protein